MYQTVTTTPPFSRIKSSFSYFVVNQWTVKFPKSSFTQIICLIVKDIGKVSLNFFFCGRFAVYMNELWSSQHNLTWLVLIKGNLSYQSWMGTLSGHSCSGKRCVTKSSSYNQHVTLPNLFIFFYSWGPDKSSFTVSTRYLHL